VIDIHYRGEEMSDLYIFENLNFNNYPHGGSRVLLEDKQGTRQLICDTYGDIDNFDDMELKSKIHETIRNYFKKKNNQYCHANNDGDCYWKNCPQLKDGEPEKTGRHCPLDKENNDER